MNMKLVDLVTKSQLRQDLPDIRPGSNVKVYVKIKEGEKTRTQIFEGLVIAKQGGGINESIIVRKLSNGVGVERTFPLHSPIVEKFEVTRVGKVRRNKLFYMRGLSGKASRIKEIRR